MSAIELILYSRQKFVDRIREHKEDMAWKEKQIQSGHSAIANMTAEIAELDAALAKLGYVPPEETTNVEIDRGQSAPTGVAGAIEGSAR
jgi:hypothetical protein